MDISGALLLIDEAVVAVGLLGLAVIFVHIGIKSYVWLRSSL